MRKSIRMRFFALVALQTTFIFCAVAGVLFFFNLHEQHEHPDLKDEEAEEALVVDASLLFLFPLALGSAWAISRRLLRPWQRLVAQAERIGSGHLDDRLEVSDTGDEIDRLSGVLNSAFDRYQNLLDRLHRFSFDASHQLRNPLAAIRTSGEVCLARPRTPDEYQSVIGGMLEDTQRLNRTVEQLLLLARASQGGLEEHRESVSLQLVARDVVEDARKIAESSGLQVDLIESSEALNVLGVQDLVRQAITNIVDNALRFSPEGGRIVVEVKEVPRGRARISVADSGPGLAPERKAVLFRPFVAHPGARESVGLGLAIAADICSAHAGVIGVDDNPDGGCVFWVELPLETVR